MLKGSVHFFGKFQLILNELWSNFTLNYVILVASFQPYCINSLNIVLANIS